MSPLQRRCPAGQRSQSGRIVFAPWVCYSSGTSCHLLYKRRLLQIVSPSEEMPGRAEESVRANDVRPYNEIYDRTRETYT